MAMQQETTGAAGVGNPGSFPMAASTTAIATAAPQVAQVGQEERAAAAYNSLSPEVRRSVHAHARAALFSGSKPASLMGGCPCGMQKKEQWKQAQEKLSRTKHAILSLRQKLMEANPATDVANVTTLKSHLEKLESNYKKLRQYLYQLMMEGTALSQQMMAPAQLPLSNATGPPAGAVAINPGLTLGLTTPTLAGPGPGPLLTGRPGGHGEVAGVRPMSLPSASGGEGDATATKQAQVIAFVRQLALLPQQQQQAALARFSERQRAVISRLLEQERAARLGQAQAQARPPFPPPAAVGTRCAPPIGRRGGLTWAVRYAGPGSSRGGSAAGPAVEPAPG